MTTPLDGSAAAWSLRKIVLIAVAYFLAGRLALLLAIPPGYAAPVWPAAGLALVGVLFWGRSCWPGVLLGSFAVNLSIAFDAGTLTSTVLSLTAAAGIAVGAVLQALVGAALVRRFVGWPSLMATPRDIGLLLLLGGPVACVISAGWGPGVLWAHGLIDASQLPFSVFTWWVGDAIGVLSVVPLVAIWTSREPTAIRRRLFASLPLAVALALAGALFLVVTRHERQQIEFGFQRGTDQMLQSVRDGIGAHLETLRSLRSLYYASEDVTPDELRIFVDPSLKRDAAIRAFTWSARVLDEQRSEFEAEARSSIGPTFRITEAGEQATLVPAARRREYVVIRHHEPSEGNERAQGYDLYSEPTRASALRQASASGEPVATPRLTLIQEPGNRSGIIIYLPVYEGGRMPEATGERWGRVRGFVAAILDAPRLLSESLTRVGRLGIEVELRDMSAPKGSQLLASSAAPSAEGSGEPPSPSLQVTTELPIEQWRWTLRFWSAPRYLEERWGWRPWAALISGLLVTGLIGAFLLIVTGRALLVEELVRVRTEDLRVTQLKLVQRNEETRTVYHTVSHELKTPLASTREFVAIVLDGIAGPLTADQREYLTLAKDGIDQMARLVEDLTDVARLETGKITLELRPMHVGPVIERVVLSLRSLALEAGLQVALETGPDCPEAQVDERRLAQIVRNLLANATKFTAGGGRIDLWVGRDPQSPACVRVVVRDTGQGIPAANLERVFDRLYQIREGDATALTAGMGLGLHICRELVRLHGGRIWVESKVGVGSVFSFTLVAVDPPASAGGRRAPDYGGGRAQEDPHHRG